MGMIVSRRAFLESSVAALLGLSGALCPAWCAPVPNRWAVIVGVGDYKKPLSRLSYPTNDCFWVWFALTQVAKFPIDHVFVLSTGTARPKVPGPEEGFSHNLDEMTLSDWVSQFQQGVQPPTKTELKKLLGMLEQNVSAGATVLFFFSGHGFGNGDDAYLALLDAGGTDAQHLKETCLGTKELRNALGRLAAREIMLFIDACRAPIAKGAAAPEQLPGALQKGLKLVPTDRLKDSVTCLSCSSGEQSFEWPEKQDGFFSYYLALGLRGGLRREATDGKGQVTAGSLQAYLHHKVGSTVRNVLQKDQNPWFEGQGNNYFELVLSRPPGGDEDGGPVPGALAPATPIKFSFEEGVEGWRNQNYVDSQACWRVIQSNETPPKPQHGVYVLKMLMDLVPGDPHKDKGEAIVTMQREFKGEHVPIDMNGREISAWVYAPQGAIGDPDHPNGYRVFVKDRSGKSEYGPWLNVEEGRWLRLPLTVSGRKSDGGFMDPLFEPRSIVSVGVFMGAGTGSTVRYEGPLYVDAVNW